MEEFIVSFTHDAEMDYILPGISPTGKRVEVPHVVVVAFADDKIAGEHIYWDQASVLVQVGLHDPDRLPVLGAEQAARLRELTGVEENPLTGKLISRIDGTGRHSPDAAAYRGEHRGRTRSVNIMTQPVPHELSARFPPSCCHTS